MDSKGKTPLELGFDPYALLKPKTKEDYIQLLDEALILCDQLDECLNDMGYKLRQSRGDKL